VSGSVNATRVAPAAAVLGPDPAPVRVDEPLRDREAEARATARAGDVELERAILIACRNGHAADLGDVELVGPGVFFLVA